jgi:hypothetical protein
MASVVEDFTFIAQRVHEIRAARYHELGVSPPAFPEQPQETTEPSAPAQSQCGGFRYAPGFEHLAEPHLHDAG